MGWACAADVLRVCWHCAAKMLPDKDSCHTR